MNFRLTLPEHGAEGRTVMDLIVSILSYKHPLSANEILDEINTQYKVEVTYQAVYKALGILLKEKVVSRDGKNFKLDIEWIKSLERFYETLTVSYFSDLEQKTETDLNKTK